MTGQVIRVHAYRAVYITDGGILLWYLSHAVAPVLGYSSGIEKESSYVPQNVPAWSPFYYQTLFSIVREGLSAPDRVHALCAIFMQGSQSKPSTSVTCPTIPRIISFQQLPYQRSTVIKHIMAVLHLLPTVSCSPLPVPKLRNMHLTRLDDSPFPHALRHLPPMQRNLIALITILIRRVPMHITFAVRPIVFARLMYRDNVSIVRTLCAAELVQRMMVRRLALLKITRTVLCSSSAAGCESAGFFEEADEEWFYGWETGGYDADVHLDDLPDV